MPTDLEIIEQLARELNIRLIKTDEIEEIALGDSAYQTDADQNVVALKIHGNRLSNLAAEVFYLVSELKNLTWLNLCLCYLGKLSSSISELQKLRHLDIAYNELEYLPPEIGKLINLEFLHLGGNKLIRLPSEFVKLQKLAKLDISNTLFSTIPPELFDLQNLRELNLIDIHWPISLARIVRPLSNLGNLTSLSLTGSDLTFLPLEILRLGSLTRLYLDLSGNKLTQLPTEIFDLQPLTGLDLSGSQLSNLPVELTKKTELESLRLGSIGAGGIGISAIPPEISMLRRLKDLDLSYNSLRNLPIEMAELKNLESLWLVSNKFAEFPSVILKLKNLKHLGIGVNGLKALPDEISNLTELKALNLYNNQLVSLPGTITQLRKLRILEIGDNPLNQPPPEIVRQGLEAVLEYLRQLSREATKRNEAKMIMVGQGDVGKTCLVNRLIYDDFKKEKSTEGISILNWNVTAPTSKQEPIRLNVWDFGGQEIYHATHQFFLTKRSVYLLVWNARKSKDYEHIYYWLHTIEAFGGNSPVVLVMTKRIERDDDLNMKDLREKFPQIVGFYKVDNEDGSGIQELKDVIRAVAWKLPHMQTYWADSWLRVRERLESDERNWIEYKQFQQICASEGLDKKQTEILDEYLHDLGIIIHFRHNLRLWNMVILKPEWATKAVYRVLDAQSVRDREGVLLHSELDTIWDTALYPSEIFPNILELMSEFELAYELPDKQSVLVAELLPSTEPEFDWSDQDNLYFYYSYDFLPAGVITRFVVLIHPYLELRTEGLHLCWREGCVLKWENTRAVVRVKKVEKIIEIRICGRQKRELLAVIRHRFDHINSSIKKVRVSQQIPCNCSEGCSHLFDYEKLILAEYLERETVDCYNTWNAIPLSRLLDGYERKEDRAAYHSRVRLGEMPMIQVQDQGTVIMGYQRHVDFSEKVEHMTKQERTIKIGKEANVSAPIVIAETIENSFNTLAEANIDNDVKQLLDQLLKEINELNKKVPQDKTDEAESMVRDAESLIKEAASSKPRRRWYEVSIEGLKQAATGIGEIADPVIAIVKKLSALLTP